METMETPLDPPLKLMHRSFSTPPPPPPPVVVFPSPRSYTCPTSYFTSLAAGAVAFTYFVDLDDEVLKNFSKKMPRERGVEELPARRCPEKWGEELPARRCPEKGGGGGGGGGENFQQGDAQRKGFFVLTPSNHYRSAWPCNGGWLQF